MDSYLRENQATDEVNLSFKVRCFIQSRRSSRLLSAGSAGLRERWGLVGGSVRPFNVSNCY